MAHSPAITSFETLQQRAAAQIVRKLDPQVPVWIFGAGNFGQALCRALQKRGFTIAGFIETTPRSTDVLGVPVMDWASAPAVARSQQLLLGILSRSTRFDQLQQLAREAGFDALFMPWETWGSLADELGWRFWLGHRDELTGQIDRLSRVAERLADQTSRDILLRLTAFRLGLDADFAGFCSPEPQYFNDITLPALMGRGITYVDCGAYNGDTYIELAGTRGILCKQAFLLEPDPANYAELVSRVAPYQNVVCLPLAATTEYTILSFNSGQGEGGAISATGDRSIAATALDQLLPNTQVDFLKLDVEGAEALVLQGARGLIQRCRPVLALSLYHNPHDIWDLPELLFELCRDYRFYIRQHYFNSFECVLYGVPA